MLGNKEHWLKYSEEGQQYERALDRSVERILERSPHCPIHGCPHVAGIGIGQVSYIFPRSICPECAWDYIKGGLL